MKKLLGVLFVVSCWGSSQVMAESISWRCSYQEVTYSAAFMPQPETRSCPKARCNYDVSYDDSKAVATINGTSGYEVTQAGDMLSFMRSEHNIVMGGTDTAEFSINTQTLTFEGQKTTSPGVSISTQGQCVVM